MTAPEPTRIAFTIGSRRLFAVTRELTPIAFSLDDALNDRVPATPAQDGRTEGARILSAPQATANAIVQAYPGWIEGAREDYRRHYIAMDGSYEDYLAGFSGKTRGTLRRKAKKFAREDNGTLDLRAFSTREEVARFLDLALPLSRLTYQARLLDAGLPEDETSRAAMLDAAGRGEMRCFLLFLHGKPVAYLSLPIEGETVIYAHLGYDPEHASLSPGTVLQMEALRALFAENRFRYFDFTEGEGAHKALFGTHSVACCSFLLLRPTLANRVVLVLRTGFDAGVARAKGLMRDGGALASARRMLRT